MDRDIRKLFMAYVSGLLDFPSFYAWFGNFSINARDQFTGADLEAIRDIALSVAEFTNGDIPESKLKADIHRYGRFGSSLVVIESPRRRVSFGSAQSAVVVERPEAFA